jgi:hypothetical protein
MNSSYAVHMHESSYVEDEMNIKKEYNCFLSNPLNFRGECY